MREEIKNPGMELSDAQLSNVSGGDEYGSQAFMLCDACSRSGRRCSAEQSLSSLIQYLKENGPYSVTDYHHCPYYTGK